MPDLDYGTTFDESGIDGKKPQSWDLYVLPFLQKIRTLTNTTGLDYGNLQTNGLRSSNLRNHAEIEVGRIKVRNDSGGALSEGDLIYFTGTYNDGTNNYPTVAKADTAATIGATFFAQGVVTGSIGDDADGTVAILYELTLQDTSTATVGDSVYLSATAGGWTLTKPTSEFVQKVGTVTVVDASAGRIVFSLGSTPDEVSAVSLGDALTSIAGLTTAADKMIYTTASDTYAVADLSSFARTILDDANAAAVRTTIGAGTSSIALASDGATRLITGDGSGGLIGQENLTFNGTTLAVTGGITISSTSTISGDVTFNDNVKVTLGTGGDVDLYYDGTNTVLATQVVGSGGFLTTAGSAGFGTTTLGSWESAYGAVYVGGSARGLAANTGAAAGGALFLSNNAYFATSNWRYAIANEEASYIGLDNGNITFSRGASTSHSAGDAFTPVASMTIDSSGIVHIGGTSTTSNWSPDAYLNIEGAIPAITLRDTTPSADVWTIANNNGTLTFANDTNNTQDLRIDESGVTTITSATTSNASLAVNNTGASPRGIAMNWSGAAPDNNTNYFFYGFDTGADRIFIWADGDLANHDGTYGTISDVKFKQDIVDMRSYWDDFKSLQYRKFRHKSDVEADKNAPYRLGLVAQEVEMIFPSCVTESPDRDGIDTYKWVKSSIIEGPIMASVVQELQERDDEKGSRILALEARVEALEAV